MVDVDSGSIGFLVVVLVEVVVRISWHLTSLIQCVFNCTWVIAHAIGSLQRVQSLVLYTLNINDYIFVKCYLLFYLQAVGFWCSITFVSQTHSVVNKGDTKPRKNTKMIVTFTKRLITHVPPSTLRTVYMCINPCLFGFLCFCQLFF